MTAARKRSSQHRSQRTFSVSITSFLDAPSYGQALLSLRQGSFSWGIGTIGTWTHLQGATAVLV